MSTSFVADGEVLYRRVPRQYYTVAPDNTLKVTSQAFAERNQRPSVNRADLCNHDPVPMCNGPTDGVVSIVTKDVRDTDTVVQNDARGRPIQIYYVDVDPAPLADNPAHAEIYVQPQCPTPNVFRKLCTRLARLANERAWEVYPAR